MSKHRHPHDRNRRDQFVSHAAPRRRRVSPNALIVAGALVFLAAVVFMTRSNQAGAIPTADVSAVQAGQDASFAIADLSDGQAHFYRYLSTAGREVRFFVMKSSDGVVRAAFDACDVCFRERRGYRQSGDNMICNNCGKAFPSAQINVLQGGCNPAPIERTVQGDRVVLRAASLDQGLIYF